MKLRLTEGLPTAAARAGLSVATAYRIEHDPRLPEESAASRVALMTLLAHELAALDARDTPANLIASRRGSVKRILNAIVTRYAIDLSD